MSTRCQIVVDGADVVIYQHCDGYPDGKHGVVKQLCPLLRAFTKSRGWDEVYLPAQIVAEIVRKHHVSTKKIMKDRKKAGASVDYLEANLWLGFGVEGYENPNSGHALHGDIEYLYVIKRDHIEVRSAFNDYNGPTNIMNTTIIGQFAFNGKPYTGK